MLHTSNYIPRAVVSSKYTAGRLFQSVFPTTGTKHVISILYKTTKLQPHFSFFRERRYAGYIRGTRNFQAKSKPSFIRNYCSETHSINPSFQEPYNADKYKKYPYVHLDNNPATKTKYDLDIDGVPPASASKDGYVTASFYAFMPIDSSELENLRMEILGWTEYLEDPALETMDPELLSEYMQNLKETKKVVVSFSKPIKYPQALTGRIYISDSGVNAQVSFMATKFRAVRWLIENNKILSGRIPPFNYGLSHNRAFKKFHVRVRQLVAAGQELNLDTISKQPTYLSPEEWHNELDEKINNKSLSQEDPILIDMRNIYEFEVGKFKSAECPDVDTFREEMDYVREKYKEKKSSEIYMYCTGGIRCTVAGAILKSEGFENIKTLRGGVIAYGRWIKGEQNLQENNNTQQISASTTETEGLNETANSLGNKQLKKESLFIGKNFTFDKRLGEPVTEDIISRCHQCNSPSDTYTNCANKSCNLLFIQCPSCKEKHKGTCGSSHCLTQIEKTEEQLRNERNPSVWDYRIRIRPRIAFDIIKEKEQEENVVKVEH
ncbi:hypothetical protein BB559_007383 [Furculomyces boomerangus]|uniref:Rhodanese domain-containing protein n=2 Tax=Harpellales TaxID=61421 RepID=A0A2T9XXN2_9FUNG|nr:hypothetical protein BB559_007383 [Furculomyces boomerangus]PVZ98770.1 hypothetical protein BB558_005220 [Smittium angustum]